MDKLRSMHKISAASETLGEPSRRRVIHVTPGGAMSARNIGVVRPRNTGVINPSRILAGRSVVASPTRSKGLNLSARISKSTNMVLAHTTPTHTTPTHTTPTHIKPTHITPKRVTPTRPTSALVATSQVTPTQVMTPKRATPQSASIRHRLASSASLFPKSPAFTPRCVKTSVAGGGSGVSPTQFNASSIQSRQKDLDLAAAADAVAKAGKEKVTTGHSVPFSITGPYTRAVVVVASAALWAANGETGTIDVFNMLSGKMTTKISARLASSGAVAKPLALMATQHHVWVGFDDGMVIVYDHLCVTQLTMGLFHAAPVVAFSILANGITISGSVDMALVRWDREDKNFEAIARIVGVSEAHQALTCMTALSADIVLCGSMAGSVVAVDCASGMQVATLRSHTARVNALVVIDNLIFSAAEDCYVNVWSLKVSGKSSHFSLQRTCTLLNRILVQVAVRDLVAHDFSRSLLVAYVDGLVERWSASPDDDFGVEQVIRNACVDKDELAQQQPQNHQSELLSLSSIGTVETMRVLALGSGGISKVWCGHRNVLEDSLTESIDTINAIIAQDAAEASAWEQKAVILRQKETSRKKKYSLLLNRLNTRWLLSCYYKKWMLRIDSFNVQEKKQKKSVCLSSMDRHRFRLLRRYFAKWCSFYDLEQRRYMRLLLAAKLERLSQHALIARSLYKWRKMIGERRVLQQQAELAEFLLHVSNGVVLAKFFLQWRFHIVMRCGKLSEKQFSLLVGKSQQRFLRLVYEQWRLFHTRKKLCKENEKNALSKSSNALSAPCVSQFALFAKAYAKITEERRRRFLFSSWRRWQECRRNLRLLRLLALAADRQHQQNIMYRALVIWQLFYQMKSFDRKALEVQEVERALRLAEETHADIFDKLQLQKRLEHLQRQHDLEQRELQKRNEQVQKHLSELDALRQSLDHFCGVRNDGGSDEVAEVASNGGFVPSVLQQMPVAEAMALVMLRLKGTVVNIYTDMSLFRQIKDRIRCGTTPAIVFLEGFQEVKRTVVNLSKKVVGATWRCGERWPLTANKIKDLPPHACNTVLQSIKAMAVSYDMVSTSEAESLASTRAEILANVDLIFLLWRASYAARRPPLPENKRVFSR